MSQSSISDGASEQVELVGEKAEVNEHCIQASHVAPHHHLDLFVLGRVFQVDIVEGVGTRFTLLHGSDSLDSWVHAPLPKWGDRHCPDASDVREGAPWHIVPSSENLVWTE